MNNKEQKHELPSDVLSEMKLWGLPKTGDAEFLVALRDKLGAQPQNIWISSRRALATSAIAAGLLVGIWIPVQNTGPALMTQLDSRPLEETVDELVEVNADPSELATFLGIGKEAVSVPLDQEDVSIDELDADESVTPESDVTIDEILKLDEPEFELVLTEIQETVFF